MPKSAAHHIWRLESALGIPIVTKGLPILTGALTWYARYRVVAALTAGLKEYRRRRRE